MVIRITKLWQLVALLLGVFLLGIAAGGKFAHGASPVVEAVKHLRGPVP